MEFQFNDGGRAEAGYKGKTGDCVCRAICIITGKPYQEVYDKLAEGNATQKRGKHEKKGKGGKRTASKGISVKRKWFQKYIKELEFKWIPTMQVGKGCKVHLKTDELPKGKLIVSVSKHYAAVVDGILYDTHDCSRSETRCVYGYYILKEVK